MRFAEADLQARAGTVDFKLVNYTTGSEEFDSALSLRSDVRYRYNYGFQLGMAALDGGVEGKPYAEKRDEVFAYLNDFPDVGALRDYAKLLVGWSAIDSGAADKAADLYVRATTLDPINQVLTVEAAQALVKVGREDEADRIIKVHVAALNDGQDDPTADAVIWGQLAAGFVASNERDLAKLCITRALVLDPNEPSALRSRDILKSTPP
jgi:tetratricopeptide (TPR) repeat protein